jgi:hypothetical protein
MLNDCLWIPGLVKYLFFWSRLRLFNQYYLDDHEEMLLCKILNNKVIHCVTKYLLSDLYNLLTKTREVHIIYTIRYKACGHPNHDLIKYIDVFSDGDLILSKSMDIDCDHCLQSKSSNTVLITLQHHARLNSKLLTVMCMAP